jgi:hypothetical protein
LRVVMERKRIHRFSSGWGGGGVDERPSGIRKR